MCGVWVALEDVTPQNGPLVYYPGSHKWAVYANEHITVRKSDLVRPASPSVYEKLWRELAVTFRCEKEVFLPKRGQALIWSACLLPAVPTEKRGVVSIEKVLHSHFLLNQTSEDWYTRVVTLNAVKGLALRFFAPLRMIRLNGHGMKCTNIMHSGLVLF